MMCLLLLLTINQVYKFSLQIHTNGELTTTWKKPFNVHSQHTTRATTKLPGPDGPATN